MKINGYLTVYNDFDYLEESILSVKDFFHKFFIIEGAWQSSLAAGYPERSDEKTLSIINKYINNKDIFLIQANEKDETAQRQLGLELCRENNAEWCIMMDADEVYTKPTLEYIKDTCLKTEYNGLYLHSYNFVNSFNRWYNGTYPRAYRLTQCAKVAYHNHVTWNSSNYINNYFNSDNRYRFFHYNYVKNNTINFSNKMDRLKIESNTDLYQQGYGVSGNIYKIPIPENEIFNFEGLHPKLMKSNLNFINNIYQDKNIKYSNE